MTETYKTHLFGFFYEMSQKHNVSMDKLNLHMDGGYFFVQKYEPNSGFNEFILLETIKLNP